MQRCLTLQYVFGVEKLQTYDAIINLPPIERDGWIRKISHSWGHVMTIRVIYSNIGSAHQIDLPTLFKDYIESFEKQQLLHYLQNAQITQSYKSSLTTYPLPVNVSADEFNRVADSLTQTALDEDNSCFSRLFSCMFGHYKHE